MLTAAGRQAYGGRGQMLKVPVVGGVSTVRENVEVGLGGGSLRRIKVA